AFGDQPVGTTSAPQMVHITSTGNGAVTINIVATTGPFLQTNNCPASLGPGASCDANVRFGPGAQGDVTGSFSVTSNATGSPHSIPLSGRGIAPVAQISPLSLDFGDQRVGTSSSPRSVTITNIGDLSMTVSGVQISGDFSQTNACGVLGVGGSCNVAVA